MWTTFSANRHRHTYVHTYILPYLLTPWIRVLLEKLTGLQLVKKLPAFYGTRWFITAFTSARQLSLSWSSSIQSIPPHPTSWRFALILFSHLRLGLRSGLYPSGFPTKTLYTPLPFPIRATCPAHLILLHLITRTIVGEEYRSLSSSLWSFLHSPGYLVPLRPKYQRHTDSRNYEISTVWETKPRRARQEQVTRPKTLQAIWW
jgi:hypothetical protein